jgi:hypothetical protein
VGTNQSQVESALLSAERRAEKPEQRIETLEEFIRNELFPRANTPPRTDPLHPPPPPSPPSSPPSSVAPGQIPGVGLDLSRVAILEIKEGNAGTVRRRVLILGPIKSFGGEANYSTHTTRLECFSTLVWTTGSDNDLSEER